MIEIKENIKKCGSGFDTLHSFQGWKIAFISHASQYGDLSVLKRHLETDEAFLLIKGDAKLYFSDGDENPSELLLEKEKLYVVKSGTWHHLKLSLDALLLAVENSNTTKENTETKNFNEKAVN
jgi:hypothetical protein